MAVAAVARNAPLGVVANLKAPETPGASVCVLHDVEWEIHLLCRHALLLSCIPHRSR
jgi:hypothetical protein